MKIPFLAREAALKKVGTPPGSLIFIGEERDTVPSIEQMDYSPENVAEALLDSLPEKSKLASPDTVSWLNVHGVHDPTIIEEIGTSFGLPKLLLEDVMNTKHRPKFEEEADYLFIILKMLSLDEKNRLKVEQISLIVSENYVISLQEVEGDVFDPIRERIRHNKGQIRKYGADYLAFALLDAIVDNYFVVLEYIGERMEGIERQLMVNPEHTLINKIHSNKMDLFFIRKAIWPLREIAGHMDRESGIVGDEVKPYFRDLYEHTIQAIDTVETFRDIASGITDLFMSTMGNRMNEVMKVLTIIATIFIPITFIAGIYGMNFNAEGAPWNMPELNWKYGYVTVWGVMIAVALVMLGYFRKKKWL